LNMSDVLSPGGKIARTLDGFPPLAKFVSCAAAMYP